MDPYIAIYGRHRDIVYARDLDEASAMAREFAQAAGMSVEESADEDEVYARPFDHWIAKDLGLIWLDELEQGYYTAEARQ